MRGQWLLPLLVTLQLAAPQSAPLAALPGCSSEKELSVSMTYSTNATGHRAVSANLDQPLRSAGWLLDVEVRTSGCGPDDAPRRSLTVTLTGPPEAEVLGPSRSPAHPGYLTLPALGHFRSPPDVKSWYAARDHCRWEGGGLVTPESRNEVVLLLGHFSTNDTAYYPDFFWHSANDIQDEGKFVTYDGVPMEDLGYAEFGRGNPTWDSSKNCLGIFKDTYLYDLQCHRTASFICKVPL